MIVRLNPSSYDFKHGTSSVSKLLRFISTHRISNHLGLIDSILQFPIKQVVVTTFIRFFPIQHRFYLKSTRFSHKNNNFHHKKWDTIHTVVQELHIFGENQTTNFLSPKTVKTSIYSKKNTNFTPKIVNHPV